ncbi:hypothetical protein DSLASN_41370 [Desulfoluna limicola]|uniref:STAS domain-containing protein n=1 Tax=Desulfoluna limicola TaxID=2810562 RepID=A0ABN6F9G9_9BACT|nr:hypothetical protein [Desulfoluna limicola]BCS98505.1 hypothetical protein DSLASN_41370 [Desulfoluna limicola]
MAVTESRLSGIAEKYRGKRLEGLGEEEVLEDIFQLLEEVEAREKEIGWAKRRIKELERDKKGESKVGRTRTAMWAIRGFTAENRLYVKMAGEFDYKGAKQFSNHILTVLDSLRSGCDVVVDISRIQENGDRKNAFHIRKVACTLAQLNVSRIIRISDGLPKGLKEMVDDIFDEIGLIIYDVPTLEDASALLKKDEHHLRT